MATDQESRETNITVPRIDLDQEPIGKHPESNKWQSNPQERAVPLPLPRRDDDAGGLANCLLPARSVSKAVPVDDVVVVSILRLLQRLQETRLHRRRRQQEVSWTRRLGARSSAGFASRAEVSIETKGRHRGEGWTDQETVEEISKNELTTTKKATAQVPHNEFRNVTLQVALQCSIRAWMVSRQGVQFPLSHPCLHFGCSLPSITQLPLWCSTRWIFVQLYPSPVVLTVSAETAGKRPSRRLICKTHQDQELAECRS